MNPELVDGLVISFVITLASVILCPVLYWVLPNRSAKPSHS